MAVKDFFINQSLNRFRPEDLPGTPADWATSDVTREVALDLNAAANVEVLPSAVVKISTTSDGLTRVLPVEAKASTSTADTPYGIVLFKNKDFLNTNTPGYRRMMTVARGGNMHVKVACKSAINAGAAIYFDPTDGYYTSESTTTIESDTTGNIKVGMALETISTAVAAGKIIKIEVQMPNV
jgi:hypothetical protein